MVDGFELRGLRLKEDLRARLQAVREPRKAVLLGLRAAMELFGARDGAIATLNPARSGAERIYAAPAGAAWDDRLLGDYLLGARPAIPPGTMLVPVERRERNWAVFAIRDAGRAFDDDELRAFFSIARVGDGVSEASDGTEQFGVARIRALARRCESGPAGLVEAILREVDTFVHGRPATDDRTLLAAARSETSAPGCRL